MGVDRIDHVLGDEALRLEGREIEVDGDQPGFAAVGPGHGGALHGGESDADLVLADVVEFLLGELAAADRVLEDGDRGRVVADDQRRRLAGRQLAEDGLRDGRDLRDARIDGGAGLEKHLDDADAVVGVGFDVLDVVDRGTERALVSVDDALLNLLRAQSRVLPDDADDRDVDRRKNIRRRPQQHERRHENEHQCGHHEGVGPTEGEADHPHGLDHASGRRCDEIPMGAGPRKGRLHGQRDPWKRVSGGHGS